MNPSDTTIPLAKTCSGPGCNKSLAGLRKDAKYCSNMCKQAAYIERHGIQTRQTPQVHTCQNRRCNNEIVGKKSTAKYCSSNCQKMEWYWKREEMIKKYLDLIG